LELGNLKMLDLSAEQVCQVISKSPRKNGRYNLFFKLNDAIGLKLSTSKEVRDANFERQLMASCIDCGPEVYGTIDDVVFDGVTYYGYFTELVETFETDDCGNVDREVARAYKEELNKLLNRLYDEIGFNFSDAHYGNLGLKNGKLVCIDFDSISFTAKRAEDISDWFGYNMTEYIEQENE
jgi:hypothetical protein